MAPEPREHDVIVAGLGVMGAAAAWQLATRGRRVLGIDQFAAEHTQGSSHGGSRVIREMAFEHPRYVPMARRAWALWESLAAAESRELLLATGALYLGAPDSAVVAGSRASAEAHGVASAEFSAAQVRARWPQFTPDEGMVGLLEQRAGVLRPERCVAACLAAAARHGATLRVGERMTSWRATRGGVEVMTDRGAYRAGALVLALGPWMQAELARLGVAVWVERVVQQWFVPRDPAAMEPSRCPVYLWEDRDGVVFYGFPLLDGAVKAAVHHRGEATTADTVRRDVGADEVERVTSYLRRWLPAAAGRHLRSAVCLYTNTANGDFLIDRHPAHEHVVLVSPCSGIGFKFAPLIGEIVADLVAGARPAIDLTPFRLAAHT